MPDAAALVAALRGLAPQGAGLGWADPGEEHPLWPGEEVPGAVPARRREFAAGRTAARMALAAIGVPGQALRQGADRAPVWPAGVVGSITHTRDACLAIALPLGRCRGVGIDLEEATPLEPELWDTILRPEEMPGMTGAQAKAVFCAKEAAYKAQYLVSRLLYGFDGMRIDWTGPQFAAVFTQAVAPFVPGDRVMGQVARVQGHLLALALV